MFLVLNPAYEFDLITFDTLIYNIPANTDFFKYVYLEQRSMTQIFILKIDWKY